MANSFYSDDELKKIGFKSIGENVKISRNACIYGASNMSIGSNVRIDDFSVLSGNIVMGDYIHIAVSCAIFAGGIGVRLEDFVGLSSRCTIYAESDDYSGEYLTNPTVNKEYRGITQGQVKLERHVILGSGTIVLPGVCIGEGTAVGSMSLVIKNLESWGIYVGSPCKRIKERSRNLLDIEKEFLKGK